MTQQTSLVMTRIGGVDYPMRSEASCKTCQSPHRLRIEAELTKGRSYALIRRSLDGLPEGPKGHPSVDSLKNHVRRQHLPLPHATQRRLIERRAEEAGRSIDEGDDPLADYVTVQQMIVQKGVELVASGQLEIKAADVVSASRFLHQVEQAAGENLDTQVWVEAVMEYMEIAKQFIPPEAWPAYGRAISRSPVLKALADKKADTVEGEWSESDGLPEAG